MSIVDHYEGLVIDLDGVVVTGDEPQREAVSFLKRNRRAKRPTVFITNNASRTVEGWVEILNGAKVKVEPSQIVTSAVATADLLRRSDTGACYVIGGEGLVVALLENGVRIAEEPDTADTVVVGHDRDLTYAKLRDATRALRRGARFVATNGDILRSTGERPEPGNGATLAYLRTATGIAPEVVGKPQTPLFELAQERLAVDEGVLVIGDQVETDGGAAGRMGWDWALSLSGLSTWGSLIGAASQPRWVIPHLAALDGPEPATIRPATEADLSAVKRLLDNAGLDSSEAPTRVKTTLVAEGPGGEIVGNASWDLRGSVAHLRAVAVAEHERGHGTGSHLIVSVLAALAETQAEWVYLLTPGADDLFLKLGFWRVHRDRVPDDILATVEGAAAEGEGALVRRLR